MDSHHLANELCAMHTEYAGTMNRLLEAYVSRGEDGVLVWMADKGGCVYATEIGTCLDLSAGRVANIIKQLEQKGYVIRKRDEEDLRRIEIQLTDEGRSTAAQIREASLLRHQQILERLGEQDAGELVCIARRVLQTLQTMQQSSR